MRILFVGSIPPIKDGIADHNYFLLKEFYKNSTDEFFILPGAERLDYSGMDIPRDRILNYDNYLDNNYDLVHLQLGNSFHSAYMFEVYKKILKTRAKRVITFHDLKNTNLAKLIRMTISKPRYLKYEINKPSRDTLIKSADHIIVYSDFIKNSLDKFTMKKTSKFYMGATEFQYDKNSERKILKINNDECILSTFGFITPRKGYEEVIYAVSNLIKKGYRIKYYIIGNFNFLHYKLYLKFLIKKLNLEDKVIFTGYLDISKTRKLLTASDIIIQPRKYSTEGASFSLTTAMFSQNPIITVNIGSMGEYIHNNVTGLVMRHNISSYEDAISKLYKNSWLQRKLANEAYKWAKKNVSWDSVAKQHLSLYKKV